MRYAIISDIHGNKQALTVVLTDIRSNRADKIICLGDIVGYGPSPIETLDSCYQNVDHFVLGNHDAAATGKLSTENFNDNAKFLIDWTSSHIEDGHKKFFSSMPLMLKGPGFRCSHGSLKNPGRFSYILDEGQAQEEFATFPEQIAFVGHSHVPGIFVVGASGNPHWLGPTNFNIEEEKRYIVNVGSVGQPRDNDIRASYCIYDEKSGDIIFRKIPFDIEAYKRDQLRQGLPYESSYFVELYHSNKAKPLRDTIGFKELSAENALCGIAELKSLEHEVKKLRKTKTILMLSSFLFVLLSSLLSLFYFKVNSEKISISESAKRTEMELAKKTKTIYLPQNTAPLSLPETTDVNIISMPDLGAAEADKPFKNWIVELSNPDSQKISCEIFEDKKQGDIPGFRLKSSISEELSLKSKPIQVKKGMRFSASAQFRKEFIEAGHISLCLILEKNDGTSELLIQNTVNEIKESDAWTRKTSITLGKDDSLREDGLLYYAIKGNFIGELLVRKCSLIKKQ
ncbi:MAG TPA: metallophosphoesterase family protein [Victivallales bacterium]|nr:metallophosphoesterase family protein [Victivallales bacterium]